MSLAVIAVTIWHTPAVAEPLDPLARAAIEAGKAPAADGFSLHLPIGRCGPVECPRAWYDLPAIDTSVLIAEEPSVASRVWTLPFTFPGPRTLALLLLLAAVVTLRWQRRRRRTRRFV